jgi:hypothetical protein
MISDQLPQIIKKQALQLYKACLVLYLCNIPDSIAAPPKKNKIDIKMIRPISHISKVPLAQFFL